MCPVQSARCLPPVRPSVSQSVSPPSVLLPEQPFSQSIAHSSVYTFIRQGHRAEQRGSPPFLSTTAAVLPSADRRRATRQANLQVPLIWPASTWNPLPSALAWLTRARCRSPRFLPLVLSPLPLPLLLPFPRRRRAQRSHSHTCCTNSRMKCSQMEEVLLLLHGLPLHLRSVRASRSRQLRLRRGRASELS
jgi:hypothetical protein